MVPQYFLPGVMFLSAMVPPYFVNVAILLVLVPQVLGHSPMSIRQGATVCFGQCCVSSAMAPRYIAFGSHPTTVQGHGGSLASAMCMSIRQSFSFR